MKSKAKRRASLILFAISATWSSVEAQKPSPDLCYLSRESGQMLGVIAALQRAPSNPEKYLIKLQDGSQTELPAADASINDCRAVEEVYAAGPRVTRFCVYNRSDDQLMGRLRRVGTHENPRYRTITVTTVGKFRSIGDKTDVTFPRNAEIRACP